MIDPRVLLILVLFAGGYYIGEQAVAGIKHIDRTVAHVVKTGVTKVTHLIHPVKTDGR